MTDLLPCPFCGCTRIDRREMRCVGCDAVAPSGATYEAREDAWNRRPLIASFPEIRAAVQILTDALDEMDAENRSHRRRMWRPIERGAVRVLTHILQPYATSPASQPGTSNASEPKDSPAPQGEDGWSELERLARAATPGPWEVAEDNNPFADGRHVFAPAGLDGTRFVVANFKTDQTFVTATNREQQQRNALFSASANPSTILKLIAAARSLPEGGAS